MVSGADGFPDNTCYRNDVSSNYHLHLYHSDLERAHPFGSFFIESHTLKSKEMKQALGVSNRGCSNLLVALTSVDLNEQNGMIHQTAYYSRPPNSH